MRVYSIKKIKLIIFIASMLIGVAAIASVVSERGAADAGAAASGNANTGASERLILTLMHDEIKQAIESNTTASRGFDLHNASAELSPLAGLSEFEVAVEVNTFSGEHEPPYALEKMVFRVTLNGKPELISYKTIELGI